MDGRSVPKRRHAADNAPRCDADHRSSRDGEQRVLAKADCCGDRGEVCHETHLGQIGDSPLGHSATPSVIGDAPEGGTLFALWTDGVASHDDPGVELTLTFPGLSAGKVVGADVLNGFEQELIVQTENGSLVIRDLLIKDYPIILRLT